MKTTTLKMSLAAGVIILSAVFFSPPVLAEEPSGTNTNNLAEKRAEIETKAKERREAAQQKASTKRDEAKKRLCENRQKAVTNIMARTAARAEKQLALITKIADRTQAFYAEKGNTLENYDILIADVASKKADAQAAIDTLESAGNSFTCNTDTPGTMVIDFKTKLKAANTALKAYKQSVKELIKGVKSVQPDSSKSGGQQ